MGVGVGGTSSVSLVFQEDMRCCSLVLSTLHSELGVAASE